MGDLTLWRRPPRGRRWNANRRLGHRTMLALSQAELAALLDERGNRGDVARAAATLQTATALAPLLGCRLAPETWAAPVAPPAAGPAVGHALQVGSRWEVVAGDERASVAHSVGMTCLVTLLTSPRTDIPVDRLSGLVKRESAPNPCWTEPPPRHTGTASWSCGRTSTRPTPMPTWSAAPVSASSTPDRRDLDANAAPDRPVARLRGAGRAGPHSRAEGPPAHDRPHRQGSTDARRRLAPLRPHRSLVPLRSGRGLPGDVGGHSSALARGSTHTAASGRAFASSQSRASRTSRADAGQPVVIDVLDRGLEAVQVALQLVERALAPRSRPPARGRGRRPACG